MSYFARSRRRFIGITVGLIAGMDFLANATINFAEAPIRGGIGVSPGQFLWVLSAYAVSGALMILLLDRLSRIMRYRDLLLAGLALFVLGSVAAALSQTLAELVVARVIQGMGGGPLMTCARILVQISVPPERRARQLQGFMLGIFIAAAPGPWLAASLIQSGDWHALFILHAVAGVLVMTLAWAMLPRGAHVTRSIGRLDGWAALAFCFGVLLWMHTLEDMRYQWLDAAVIVRILLAMSAFGVLAWHLRTHPDPWFRVDSLASRRYLTGLGLYTCYYFINGAVTLITPMALLSGEAMGLACTGRLLSAGGLCTVLVLPFYFRYSSRLPDRRFVMTGGFLLMSGLLLWFGSRLTGETPPSAILPILMLKGLFPVLVVIQVAGLTFREFKHLDFAHAYAVKNVLRLLANAVGSGIANLYWQERIANSRTALIGRFDAFHAGENPFAVSDTAGWAHLSQLIDQQAALISATQVFTTLAALSALGAIFALLQKSLR